MFGDLLKAAVGAVVLPVAVVKDVVTLGGSVTDEPSAIGESLKDIEKNLKNATKPEEK